MAEIGLRQLIASETEALIDPGRQRGPWQDVPALRVGQGSAYRAAWPDHDGQLMDSVGHGLLRMDWESGQATPVDWFDDPAI